MRGADGTVVCSGYGKLGKVLEAAHTEIIACLQALQRAAMLGIQKVVLETDALMVVQAVNAPVLDRSSASGLLWELKECLHINFSSFV
jgi:ribonuclease HI